MSVFTLSRAESQCQIYFYIHVRECRVCYRYHCAKQIRCHLTRLQSVARKDTQLGTYHLPSNLIKQWFVRYQFWDQHWKPVKRDIGQSLSTSVIQLTLDCFRLSDSGEDAKEKGTHEKLAGREKGKRLWVMGSCWRVFVLLTKLLQQRSRPDSKQALSASKHHSQHI